MRYFNCLLLGAVALYGLNAEAQDEKTASKDSSIIKKDITIQKAYVPTLRDASKINETPAVDEPDFKQQPVNYTQYSTLLNPPYDFHQLDAARLKIPQSQIGKKGFLRLGMGNYW